jgi:hypothetical protein
VRSSAVGVLVGAVALASTGAVVASPQFKATLEFTYSSQTPDSPSGIDSFATWSDPGEPAGKPKEIERIKVVFHPGTRLDTSALPRCTASNAVVQRLGLAACPRSTRLGTVNAKGVISTGAVFEPLATLFNGRREIIVVVMLGDRLLTNFRDDVRRRSITINAKIPGGIALTSFRPHIPRHFGKRGKRRRAYMRTPPTCPPSGFWTTAVTFTYRDGSTQQLTAPSPCRRG